MSLILSLNSKMSAIVLIYLIVWVGIRQVIVSAVLKNFYDSTVPLLVEDDFCPRASILLCLRGADPLLKDCLTALSQQDYPDYQVQIVVDHQEDPAWEILNRFLEQNQAKIPFNISILDDKSPCRSLKCSSILQAIGQLDSDCEAVAFIDADVVPHSTWLRELVTPLAHPEIGVTSGTRWYMPHDSQQGSLVRYFWNYSAAIMIQFLQIPWGGTFAMRTKTLHECQLPKLWERSLVEDTPLYQAVTAKGLRVQYIPSLLMINRESCDFIGFLQWSQRQAMFVRLYHRAWYKILAYNASYIIFYVLIVGALSFALWQKLWLTGSCIVIALLLDFIMLFLQARLIGQTVHQTLEKRGEKISPASLPHKIRLLMVTPLLVICCLAVLLVPQLNRIKWRGILYEISGPWEINMKEYQPYQKDINKIDSIVSL
jgi:cellulose synthase/poly-beta-1,6-N-acetylglucosamine synthase-like glycosyltransferase